MLKLKWCAAAAVLGLATAPFSASASVFGTNLIVNGDGEAAVGAANDSSTVPVPGFTPVGQFTTVKYNAPGGFPVTGDAGVSAGGANLFTGGPDNASSSGSQLIDISSGSAFIDLGASSYALSAYLGGFSSQRDNAVLTIQFLDGLSALLGTTSIGPVTNGDRGNATGLLFRSASGFVPIGARAVNVTLQLSRVDGAYNDGYADNLSLVLTGGTGGGVPEPATWAMMIVGLGAVGSVLRRRRAAAL
jgi:hypothetical protein